MEPYLHNGDQVVVLSYLFTKPMIGDVIIFEEKFSPYIFCKRVIKITGKSLWVEGDNKDKSIDSRRYGAIKKESVIGKVVLKI